MAQIPGNSFVSLDPLHPLTEAHVYKCCLHEDIGGRWKELARNLGFKRVEVDAIQSENSTESERCIHLLVRWMEREGQKGATVGKLAEALTKTRLTNLAERLIGPSNGRRTILIEITGTLKLGDGNEVMLGIDCCGKTIYFMWPESEEREFKTSPEELKKCVDASSQIVAEMGTSAKEKIYDFSDKEPRTLQELYTGVNGITREACKCDELVRVKFYDFTYHSLRAVHNDLIARVAELQSEEKKMTETEKIKLKCLVSYRNGREREIVQLEKLWKRLFSPSRIPRIKKKRQDKESCVLTSYKTDNDRNQDKEYEDEKK
ncbi:Receptor-interacting serine/threonine-protein kinase 1 [Stylophora pistillata]|uniref:Receptor-interacting serine/threonine-protein kinase 1 n=1 Tax=Stylophora pistillata TaxID=50429 RepID=A0A2B4RNY5_STYPI|nr:Receptor-interacting serine/threonine-protein kinase 1 [Stylophora pistillata]